MIEGKLKNGFKFEIDETQLDDYYFFQDLAQSEKNPLKLDAILTKLLGEEQKKAFLKSLENEQGRVPHKAVIDGLTELFSKAKAKN